MFATYPTHLILPDLIILKIFGKENVMKIIIQFSSPDYFTPLSKYSSQHRSETPSVYVLSFMCEAKFHTHTNLQEKSEFVSSYCRQQRRRQKVLNWIVGSIIKFNLILISSWMKFWFDVMATFFEIHRVSQSTALHCVLWQDMYFLVGSFINLSADFAS
jgi:hypothetical protein